MLIHAIRYNVISHTNREAVGVWLYSAAKRVLIEILRTFDFKLNCHLKVQITKATCPINVIRILKSLRITPPFNNSYK